MKTKPTLQHEIAALEKKCYSPAVQRRRNKAYTNSFTAFLTRLPGTHAQHHARYLKYKALVEVEAELRALKKTKALALERIAKLKVQKQLLTERLESIRLAKQKLQALRTGGKA